MSSPADFFEEITRDREHGASQLYARFLLLLHDYLNQLPDLPDSLIGELPGAIVGVRPEMSPFHYAARRVRRACDSSPHDPNRLRECLLRLVEELQQEETVSLDRIAEYARGYFPPLSGMMLHSYSGTVARVIVETIGRQTKLFISEGHPGCEGIRFATKLAQAGYDVVTFPDDARLLYLPDVEMVLLGTDWLGETDFTNKIGSRSLALGAAQVNIPVAVACATSKMVPSRFRPPRAAQICPVEERISRQEPLFEETENRLVDHFLTDAGILSPAEVSAQISTRWR
jgi:translation initiation factor 2B subunit (eIF-2B alpha/beta/delta family)